MIALLGIDCAVDPRKTGLALGELRGGVVHILRCAIGTKREPPAIIATDWLHQYDEALIALDAPLGWPRALGALLSTHKAGLPIQGKADDLFRRGTDVAIKHRLGKQPLEVGANFIARTAVAALTLLDRIHHITGQPIPLAWAKFTGRFILLFNGHDVPPRALGSLSRSMDRRRLHFFKG